MVKVAATLAVALLLAAAPVGAQEKKVNFTIGGGWTITAGEVRDHLGDGYNFNIGLIFNLTETVGLQTEYSFNGLGEKRVQLPVSPTPVAGAVDQDFFANMNMQFFDVNLIFKPSVEGRTAPYALVGGGVYYRPVEVTTPSVGYVPGFCDPWWYVCYPGGFVPVEEVVGERSSTDFGMDFGGGVNIGLGESASMYVEARYHYIWGPEVTDPRTQETRKANGQFFPITVGFRF